MIKIAGVDFLTTKEASYRYGYSSSWFKRRRWQNKEPSYSQLGDNGRVLYHLEKTDKWFKDKFSE